VGARFEGWEFEIPRFVCLDRRPAINREGHGLTRRRIVALSEDIRLRRAVRTDALMNLDRTGPICQALTLEGHLYSPGCVRDPRQRRSRGNPGTERQRKQDSDANEPPPAHPHTLLSENHPATMVTPPSLG
jgi:hypothetical protein